VYLTPESTFKLRETMERLPAECELDAGTALTDSSHASQPMRESGKAWLALLAIRMAEEFLTRSLWPDRAPIASDSRATPASACECNSGPSAVEFGSRDLQAALSLAERRHR
jgi:hypothetical protein